MKLTCLDTQESYGFQKLPALGFVLFQAGALDVLCHAVSCYPSDPVVAEPGVKALQEIMELGAVRDAAVEVTTGTESRLRFCLLEKMSS